MASYRPSPKAALLVGALVLMLVTGATSGAVAARLITSKDIKDGTIKKVDLAGSVKKELGEAGPPGPAGPAGLPGARGADGKDGASLVGLDFFGMSGWDAEGDDFELLPASGERLVLPAGHYLVTVQAAFLNMSGGDPVVPILFYGHGPLGPGPGGVDLGSFIDACTPTPGPVVDLPFDTCDVTYPLIVPEGETFTMGAHLPSTGEVESCTGESCESPVFARAAVYRQSGELPDFLCELSGQCAGPELLSGPAADTWERAARTQLKSLTR